MKQLEIVIHKEQNVIKTIIIISIFMGSYFPVLSQSVLNNTYYYCDGVIDNASCIVYKFNDTGVFEKDVDGELGKTHFGKGHYQIKNDSLILNYDLTELKYESYYKLKKFYNAKDSIQVNLNVKDFDNNSLKEIGVITDPLGQSTNVNKKGKASLIFKKGSFKDKIKLYVDGAFWAECIILLDSDTNYNIDVFMSKSEIIGLSHPKAIKGIKLEYKIIENSKETLKLKSDNQVLTLEKR